MNLGLKDNQGSSKTKLEERGTEYNLKAPVTEKNPTGKRAARRKSFCARMKGVKGPMKDSKGRPTRKALALKRWRC